MSVPSQINNKPNNGFYRPADNNVWLSKKEVLYLQPELLNLVDNMKKEIHPENYRMCVFKDMSNGYTFLTRSCADTKETLKWEDGNDYPLVKLDISMTSHPFYTGKQVLVDTAGRVDKFRTRYAKKK